MAAKAKFKFKIENENYEWDKRFITRAEVRGVGLAYQITWIFM